MMQSSIRYALGISSGTVSQRRIATSLKRLAPLVCEARARDTLDRTNPIPYFAPYFGYEHIWIKMKKLLRDSVSHMWL